MLAIVHKAKPGDRGQNDSFMQLCGRTSTANMAQRPQDTSGYLFDATSRHSYKEAPYGSEAQKCSLPWASPEHRDALVVSCRVFSHTSSSCLIQGRTLGADSSWPVSAEKRRSSEGIRCHGLSCHHLCPGSVTTMHSQKNQRPAKTEQILGFLVRLT